LFGGMITIMLAKFCLNDMPHLLLEGNPGALVGTNRGFSEFLNKVIEQGKAFHVDLDGVYGSMKVTSPKLAHLLRIYYYIAHKTASVREVEKAKNISYREVLTLVSKYRSHTGPKGKLFWEVVGYLHEDKLSLLAADTMNEKAIAVDMFVSTIHTMIVDRWEGEDLGGSRYPVAFDMTNMQAELVRIFVDKMSR